MIMEGLRVLIAKLKHADEPKLKTARNGRFSVPLVAGTGIEPVPQGYEPCEVPLLHPAM